jgi:hypothetical protein
MFPAEHIEVSRLDEYDFGHIAMSELTVKYSYELNLAREKNGSHDVRGLKEGPHRKWI